MKPESAPSLLMATFISHSPAETESLGEEWGREAQCGAVIALRGELGAGKTQLVRGFARGLGITARIHSPTFTLVNEYGGGRLRVFHLDLYRLETPEHLHNISIEEFLKPDGVAIIEWAERIAEEDWRKMKCRRVTIEVTSETERRITYEDSGA